MRTLIAHSPDVIAEHRRELVEALRSGAYAQARGRLRIDDSYCCLGVAERLRGCSWVKTDPDVGEEKRNADESAYVVIAKSAVLTGLRDRDDVVLDGSANGEGTVLSPDGMYWLGVLSRDPFVVMKDNEGSWAVATLANLNDSGDYDFARIADVIEAQHPDWDGTEAWAYGECARRESTRAS